MVYDLDKKGCLSCGNQDIGSSRFCGECGAKIRNLDDIEVLHLGICPSCERYDVLRVIRTDRPKRELKCERCGDRFESVEIFTTHHDACSLAAEILKDKTRF